MSKDKPRVIKFDEIKNIIRKEENLNQNTRNSLVDFIDMMYVVVKYIASMQEELADLRQSLKDMDSHKRR